MDDHGTLDPATENAITRDPEYDPFCRQQLNEYHPFLARLREQDPVHWCEPMGMWILTRYDDISELIQDRTRLISSREGMYRAPLRPENREAAEPLIQHVGLWLQNVNPPQHTRIRKLVSKAFTPRMVENMAPRIEGIVNELIDQTLAEGETDFVNSFCFPLPARVICEMMGIPAEEQQRFRESIEGLIPFVSGAGPGLNEAVGPARECMDDLLNLFDDLLAQRKADPKNDLLSAMAAAEEDGDRLSRDELFALCNFLFLAGHETTMSLLSSGTAALLQQPWQWELLKSDPDGLAESTVEELTRFVSPVTRAVRVPVEDIEIRGTTLPEGETITMLFIAANRDPEAFDRPNEVDITRSPNKHYGFGHGIHFCLGAPLARLEGRIAFNAIARRLPDLELATETIRYKPALGIRSAVSLPIRTNA